MKVYYMTTATTDRPNEQHWHVPGHSCCSVMRRVKPADGSLSCSVVKRQATLPGATEVWERREVSCACSRLFVFFYIVSSLAGTGCPGGWPVTDLSVLCRTPLWKWAIDETQQQEEWGQPWNRKRRRKDNQVECSEVGWNKDSAAFTILD